MKTQKAWILVEVRSGIPVSVRMLSTEVIAKAEEAELRKSLNLENDETGVFEVNISKENHHAPPKN